MNQLADYLKSEAEEMRQAEVAAVDAAISELVQIRWLANTLGRGGNPEIVRRSDKALSLLAGESEVKP